LGEVVGRARSQLDRQIAELNEQRGRREQRTRRLNEDLCGLSRAPDMPGTAV
jgi:hypothetical protein